MRKSAKSSKLARSQDKSSGRLESDSSSSSSDSDSRKSSGEDDDAEKTEHSDLEEMEKNPRELEAVLHKEEQVCASTFCRTFICSNYCYAQAVKWVTNGLDDDDIRSDFVPPPSDCGASPRSPSQPREAHASTGKKRPKVIISSDSDSDDNQLKVSR